MHVEKLNNDILSQILGATVFGTDRGIDDWKSTIPLLHVNQRWRGLAAPLVLKNVLIESYSMVSNTQPKLESNLPFVTIGKNYKHIRSLKIRPHFSMGSLMVYRELYKVLVEYRQKLRGIQTITMGTFDWDWNEENYFVRLMVSQLGNLAIKTMPNVTALEFYESSTSIIPDDVYGPFIDKYKHQLTRLVIENTFTLPQNYSLSKLSDLEISLGIPANIRNSFDIVADSLVRLLLIESPHLYQWENFRNSGGNQSQNTIKFWCLKSLKIVYTLNDNSQPKLSENGITLHFPVLEELYLTNLTTRSTILQRCVFPQSLSFVKLRASTNNLRLLTQSRLMIPQPDTLALSINIHTETEEQDESEYMSNVINMFLGQYHGRNRTMLDNYIGCNYKPDYKVAKLAKLSTIYLNLCKSMTTVIDAIVNAPNLVTLSAIVPPSFQMLDLAPNTFAEKLEPFNTKVENLVLDCDMCAGNSPEKYLANMFYLMLRISSLKKVHVQDFALEDIDKFIQSNKNRYPHLNNVQTGYFINLK